MPVPRRQCPRNTTPRTAIPPLLMAVAALLAAPLPVLAQSVRTVVVPSGSGVVVAPRSAPPRLAARPPGTLPAASARLHASEEAAPEGGGALPLLSLVPLAAAAALFAAGASGDGGAPSRTR
jgi:type IV secretory pathway VirJ component